MYYSFRPEAEEGGHYSPRKLILIFQLSSNREYISYNLSNNGFFILFREEKKNPRPK